VLHGATCIALLGASTPSQAGALVFELPLFAGRRPLRNLLVLGAHADDIEIGCGATILALTRAHPTVEVTWVVLGAEGEREQEARASARAFLSASETFEVIVHDFRDGFFPYVGGAVKEAFEELKSRVSPELILTHSRADLHQDHRLVCELTWNTWRDHLVLEYEIPKFDGDLGRPNVFVPISAELVAEKVRLLLDAFPSQRDKHWFDEELFRGLMRIRGMESASPTGFAEAFAGRKLSLASE
jgi:LmbE family N-acetylglucosaminyl deacetylase